MASRFSRLVDRTKQVLSREPPRTGRTSQGVAVEHPQGLEVVSEGQDPIVDIVALHGLNGHRERTWTAENGVHWLRDLLPEDLPHARILCWGYNANTHAADRVSWQSLYDHARTLVSDLCRKRKLTNGGNGVQLGRVLANVASLFVAANDRLLKHLARDSEWLQQQLGQYASIINDFVTKYAFKEYETPTVLGRRIVLNARDKTSLNQSFRHVAVRILQEHPGLSYMQTAVSDKDGDASLAVRRWLDEPTNERWLLIYDNYDHPKMGGDEAPAENSSNSGQHGEADQPAPEGYDIRPYLPDTDHGAVILTTRSSTVQIGELLRLEKLRKTEDSLRILESTSGRTGVQDVTDAAAVTLARKLGGLPLALSTAGTYLTQVSTSWEQYLQDYESAWGQLQKLSPQLLTYENRAMYSTWNISFASIRRQSESATMLLRLWAFFGNGDLWYELLRRGGTEDGPKWLQDLTATRLIFDQNMRVLCSHGLVEAHSITAQNGSESGGYSVHACVHSWMIHVLNGPNEQVLAVLALKCTSLHVPEQNIPEYWLIQRRLLLHGDRCRQLLSETDNDGNSAWVSGALGDLYSDQGRYKDAEEMYERALEDKEKAWGPEHTSTLSTIYNLGLLYHDQGQYKEAEAMHEQVLQCEEIAWGPEHVSTLHTVNSLGNIYSHQGRYNETEAMYEQALESKEKVCGPEHISTLDTVNNLAALYVEQRRYREAEAMYQRALEGYGKVQGPEHISIARVIHNLGNLYAEQGRYKEAEALLKRALERNEEVWGPEREWTLSTVSNLGHVYIYQQRYTEAEALYDRALEGYKKVLGPDHPSTLITFGRLGDLYAKQKRYEEAEVIYKRVLEGKEKLYGPGHISTLAVVNNLGIFYSEQGRPEAEAMIKRALEGYEKVWGPEDIAALEVVTNLGSIYKDQGRFKEAEVMYERVVEGYQKSQGEDAVTFVPFLHTVTDLGDVNAALGQVVRAGELYKIALPGVRQVFGDGSDQHERLEHALASLSS
ncbi:hypothetical protein CHGG_10954 [Chaetomium globosum CBS 148.51]|uniref:Uncharacterized protein n=1 Tax=Chaetomium globosum (strain ATCC 6205 / CBS 148.51 / DSM 1962 / NBRC 6347 / NRRL 1970) TaxID=306901 RepID=Q2GM50_CHAGB|nr:uncharacterized protein CHGG_10954 [Chaetomium globosum CBS 148.51]EAQ83136.1 hypothetical protein CHGG_10954 [Chaetomium globosum CBS 148.51]